MDIETEVKKETGDPIIDAFNKLMTIINAQTASLKDLIACVKDLRLRVEHLEQLEGIDDVPRH